MKIRNFVLVFVISKLVEFPLFNNFFYDIAEFQDLDVFSLFYFLDLNYFLNFLACFILFLPASNPLTLLLLLFFPKAGLLVLFLLKADLLPSFLLGHGLLGDPIIFSIKVGEAAILLKL